MKTKNKNEIIKDKCIYRRYDSVLRFTTYLQAGKVQPAFESHVKRYGSEGEYNEWYKTDSFEAAQDLMESGDRELQAKLEKMGVSNTRTQIAKMMPKRQQYANVVGFMPHVPNYIAGVPLQMIDESYHEVPAQAIDVYYNCAAAGSESADSLAEAAAKFLSACMIIEAKNNIRLNIFVCEIAKKYIGRGKSSMCQYIAPCVRIKTAGQQFNTLKMAYPMCHPSMLRRHMFRWLEVTEGIPSEWVGGYGYIIFDDTECAKVLRERNVQVDVMQSYDSCKYCKTVQDVINLIEADIKNAKR